MAIARTDSQHESGGKSLHATQRRWFAVYVPFRREKSAFERLTKRGITCYLPLLSRTKRYQRKIKQYEVPLIHHYLFVHINKEEYVKVLGERDVLTFIKFEGRPSSISQNEIDILKKVVGDYDVEMTAWEDRDWLGKEVELIQGQLTGLKGRISEVLGKKKFMVRLHALGMMLAIEVPHEYLIPIR